MRSSLDKVHISSARFVIISVRMWCWTVAVGFVCLFIVDYWLLMCCNAFYPNCWERKYRSIALEALSWKIVKLSRICLCFYILQEYSELESSMFQVVSLDSNLLTFICLAILIRTCWHLFVLFNLIRDCWWQKARLVSYLVKWSNFAWNWTIMGVCPVYRCTPFPVEVLVVSTFFFLFLHTQPKEEKTSVSVVHPMLVILLADC